MSDNRFDYFKRWVPQPAKEAAAQGARLMGILRPNSDQQVPISPELRERVASFPITREIGPRALNALLASSEWFSLPGGAVLTRDGDNHQAVFIVVTGCLGVFTPDELGNDHFIAQIPSGETVGEMSVITGDAHSAKLIALRDSELLRISKSRFERLLARHPRLSLNLMRILIRRLRHTTRRAVGAQTARTIAFVPLHPGIDCRAFGENLSRAFSGIALKAGAIGPEAAGRPSEWFAHHEAANDVVLYIGDTPESAWTQLCVRQADRIFLVANAGEAIAHRFHNPETRGRLKRQHPELVLLRKSGGPGLSSTPLGPNTAVGMHHYLREGDKSDISRFARILSGRAVSLVLAGGGARGFAHIGVIRALQEAGVPFDFVGGSSMGAIIAAGVAMGWDNKELSRRVRHAFVDANPLSDFTLPLVAVLRGKKVSKLLREHFGDVNIEDLSRMYFCVSSNLTLGRAHIHKEGQLWKALRATVAIPGLLPPVVHEKNLLVDGGLMNNMPVDIMATFAQGPVIGIDVAGDEALVAEGEDFSDQPWLSLFRQQLKGAPSIVSILMRSGTVGNEVQRRQAREQADLLFDPPLPGLGLRSWHAFDEAIEAGYVHALQVMEERGLECLGSTPRQPAIEPLQPCANDASAAFAMSPPHS
ncbi:MAG: patatin-like phospholipase family protein [Alphaproteobacteria bacterium]|nr:patatin-like phospholipase family protein [Alphaproteobacteria bacterium]